MEDKVTPTIGSELDSGFKRGRTVEECQEMIRRSFRTSPMVKFLKEQMEKAGCRIEDNFIKAVICGRSLAAGYSQGDGIVICSNHLTIQGEVNQAVIHELIHAYDDCRAKNLDWKNCAHHACSEIRANHLSGDCHFKCELFWAMQGGLFKIRGREQECIRRRALKSLRGNPSCAEVGAKDAMDAVWDICYNDLKPFDRAP